MNQETGQRHGYDHVSLKERKERRPGRVKLAGKRQPELPPGGGKCKRQEIRRDGYLFTTRTIDPDNPAPGSGEKRWSNLASSHELYNVGHMYEAAVAYYQATGKRNFLDVALKNADLIAQEFGPGKRQDFPGHQEIEIGLVKLFRLTGDESRI